MRLMLQRRLITLLQAMAIAWPASAFALELHAPGPIPPVQEDEDDDDDDDKPGGGSGGGSIDPDDDEGGSDDDDDDDEETLWTQSPRCGAP